MKQIFSFIKNIYSNKRTRSLAILILYLIFFIFVFSLLSIPNKNNNDEFYYLNNVVIGSYNVLNNEGEVTYYNTDLINTNNIYKMVKNSKLESTNYLENSNTYVISVSTFEKILYNNDVVNNDSIRITLYSNKIVLDFSNYYGYIVNIELRS